MQRFQGQLPLSLFVNFIILHMQWRLFLFGLVTLEVHFLHEAVSRFDSATIPLRCLNGRYYYWREVGVAVLWHRLLSPRCQC